jgi:hypothetical protein
MHPIAQPLTQVASHFARLLIFKYHDSCTVQQKLTFMQYHECIQQILVGASSLCTTSTQNMLRT